MAKRGRKPKEKKGYFEEIEEQAVVEYNKYGKIISDSTRDILRLTFGCGDEELDKLLETHSLFELLQIANDAHVTDEETANQISELKSIIRVASIKRDKIYNSSLSAVFSKMIESLIRRYKLYIPDEEFDDTFADTLSYLMTKISNFNPENGTKAYSYCGTVCKNYLILKKVQYQKNLIRSIPYDLIQDGLSNNILYSDTKESKNNVEFSAKIMLEISDEIEKMIASPAEYKLNENEIRVGAAIIELLRNWENIVEQDEKEKNELLQDEKSQYKPVSNKLHKSKVLYFLREETMMTTKEVRDNMKKYKTAYLNVKKKLQE